MVALIVVGLMALTTAGCGGGNTPSETVDEFYRSMQEKNCQGVSDLVTDTKPELADRYVNDCKQIALVSYSIKGETIDGTGHFAKVDVEVTIIVNGVEKTNYPTRFLVKRDDDWKLTEIR